MENSTTKREERSTNNNNNNENQNKETGNPFTIPYQPKYSEKEAVQKIAAYWKCYFFRKHTNSKLTHTKINYLHTNKNY